MPKNLVWTPELVREFWNNITGSSLDDLAFAKNAGVQLLDIVQSHIPSSGRVVDYGAGVGHFSKELCSRGYQVAVYEPSAEHLVPAIREEKNITLLNPNNITSSYDVIFCLETIEHILDQEMDEFFKNLHSLLKPGGHLVVSTPHNENLEQAKVYCVKSDCFFHPWQHVRSFKTSTLVKLLQENGFHKKLIGLADFSADARVYDDVRALNSQISDLIPLIASFAKGLETSKDFTKLSNMLDQIWDRRWNEIQESFNSRTEPLLNQVNELLRRCNLEVSQDIDDTENLKKITYEISKELNNLAVDLENEDMPPAKKMEVISTRINPIAEQSNQIQHRAEYLRIRSIADELTKAKEEIINIRDEFQEILRDPMLSTMSLKFKDKRKDSYFISNNNPIGVLSEIDDHNLIQIIDEIYRELLGRQGSLQNHYEEYLNELNFKIGRGVNDSICWN